MKRLREGVGAVSEDVWAAQLNAISRNVSNDEFVRFEVWLRATHKRETCSIRFAFGLALRHVAIRRYPDDRDCVERTVRDIIGSGTLVGILLAEAIL